MSDTPRTDAQFDEIAGHVIAGRYSPAEGLDQARRFARQLERELAQLRQRVAELELSLTAIGEIAVIDFDGATVGKVDAVVKEPVRYRDELRKLFDAAQRVKELEAERNLACENLGRAVRRMSKDADDSRELIADLRARLEAAERKDNA